MVRQGPTDVALFRYYEVIAPLLSVIGPRGTLKLEVAKIASKQHAHPRRGLIAVGAGTIEEWLLRYRRDGLDGLEDRRRRDLGKSRRIDAELADAIVEIAEGRPDLEGAGLLSELAATLEGIAMPSLSALYRFCAHEGSISAVLPAARTIARSRSTSPATAGRET